MDARLNQNEAELGVLVIPVALKVLAHGDGLLDQVVEVLRQRRRKTCSSAMGAGEKNGYSGYDATSIA